MPATTKRTARPKSAPAAPSRTAMRKAQGISLNVGLNEVNPQHYGGWDGKLVAAEADARQMETIAVSAGMQTQVLLSTSATRAKVLSGIKAAARTLVAGDLFLLSYSGNGGEVPDMNGDEADRQDRTWCLYDAQLIDDELHLELSRFSAGVRVLVVSDTCHSGTVTRAVPLSIVPFGKESRTKFMPAAVTLRTYREHQAFYSRLQLDAARASAKKGVPRLSPPSARSAKQQIISKTAPDLDGAVLLFSACQTNQMALDGPTLSLFTSCLSEVWGRGAFKGGYARFLAAVKAAMPPSQTPELVAMGKAREFILQRPFTV